MSEINSTPKSNTEVCLVQVPYGPLEQPHVGLSILKTALLNAQITATVLYANLFWAEEIGIHVYDYISHNEGYVNLVGEWTFSESVFPDFKPSHEDYFQHIQPNLQRLDQLLQELEEQKKAQQLLWELREKAKSFVKQMAQNILKLQPRIVGCSSMLQQHCASLALLKTIKELNPNIVTILGGSNCETSMGIVTHKKCAWLDFVVSGEAELLFPPLCEQILLSGPNLKLQELPEGVLGPAHRRPGENGYIFVEQSPPRAQVKDMRNVPIPDYDDYFNTLKTSSISDMIIPNLTVETSRGCWWGEVKHCIFCGINVDCISYRSKAPEQVINEFEYLSERYQTKNIVVVDSILDMHYFKTVIPTLIEQAKKYNIFYQTKANLKREHLQKMAKAGILWIGPGIETLDNTLLNKLGKGTTVHQNIQLMKWAREIGIFIYWVMIYDIPTETDDIYLKMAKWLPKIAHLQPPTYLNQFEYLRFSQVHQQPERFGLKMSPVNSYSFIYPWDAQAIEDFAYCFSDSTRNQGSTKIDNHADLQRPGLQAVLDYIMNWQQEWKLKDSVNTKPGESATLVMIDDGEQIEITDTRAYAVQTKFYLKGLSRQIYHICDKAHKIDQVLRELQSTYHANHTQDAIKPYLQELCEQGLLLNLDGYFLSLAVQGPLKPMLHPSESPLGYLENIAYTKLKKLFLL